MIALNFFLSRKLEGFQSSNKPQIDPMVVCPAIRSNIETHESLLEGYTASDAVLSVKQTKHAIELLNASYSEHGCTSFTKAEVKAAEVKETK